MQTPEVPLKESLVNIIKLVQIHRINTKFSVNDHHLNIELKGSMTPHNIRNTLVDEYYRTLWLIFEESYFRSLQNHDFHILSYVSYLFSQESKQKSKEEEEKEFRQEISLLFSHNYLQQNESWFSEAKDVWKQQKTFLFDDKRARKILKKTRGATKKEQKELPRHKKSFKVELYSSQQSEIQIQIAIIEQELESLVIETQNLIDSLLSSIKIETEGPEQIFPQLIANQLPEQQGAFTKTIQKSLNIKDQLEYLRYQILRLQEKQIAESLFTLTSINEVNGESCFVVSFDPAFGVKPLKLSQEQLLRYNSLREISFLNYYFVGWKSRFNYTCHNLYGFKDLIQSNRQEMIPRQKSIEEIRRLRNRAFSLHEIVIFNQMEMCHQCKCIFETKYLKKCQFQCQTPSKPISLFAFDSYVEALTYSCLLKASPMQRRQEHRKRLEEMVHLRSNFFRYPSSQGTSYCDRYYCKMCIKTYSQLKNSHLCPFCQGICQCSRCLRNETIFKLRSLYIHLGGRSNELPKESVFEDISEEEQAREIVSKIKKGSPQDQKRKLQKMKKTQYTHHEFLGMKLLTFKLKLRERLKLELVKSRKDVLNEYLKEQLGSKENSEIS